MPRSRQPRLDEDEVVSRVGRRIGELREAEGLRQDDLAEKADLSWKYIQQVESGRENLTLKSLVRFANLLRCSIEALFEPPTKPPRPRGRPRKNTPAIGASTAAAREPRRRPKR